ncbi:MAG: Crp/Fnr family transcriptional regulator [Ruminococcaceae bacterium]|nr:Crp/Fnr family transcriptional regulator [Oscillospiraceae bacterium]
MEKVFAHQQLYSEHLPFWKELNDADKETLCRSSAPFVFPKGKTIHDGNECTGVIIIKSGCLRIYMLSDEGKEITLYRLFAGEICILSASCVLQSITFDVFVTAEEDSECHVIGGCAFADICERVPSAKIFALESAVSAFSDAMWAFQQIMFMSLEKRLAVFIVDEIAKNNSDMIKLTHEQIAKYMGSAREAVSRMLKQFSSDGIVELSRKGITVVDKQKLRNLAE